MTPTRTALGTAPMADRSARAAERLLRIAGDARVGIALLLVAALANVVAALVPGADGMLAGWPYAGLLGGVALTAVASVAVRAPAAWREWRHPGPVSRAGAVTAASPTRPPAEVLDALRRAGYRARLDEARRGWAVHGVRRGWSRFAGVLSHAALVVIVLGAAAGAAFGSETTFSLLPGEQALLDAPRAGFSAALRLESLDAAFTEGGRPVRLDTRVTFLRDGQPVRAELLRVNEPADFDGHLVHPWTYGPAARLRVATLGEAVLLDDAIPLPEERDGVPVGSAELPTAGVTLGLALVDPDANVLGVSLVGTSGLVETARLELGERVRVGNLTVELRGFDAWVTFLSRRDPGLGLLFGGAALLCATLAVAFWLPRRRVTVRPAPAGLTVLVRGERFDRPGDELPRLLRELSA